MAGDIERSARALYGMAGKEWLKSYPWESEDRIAVEARERAISQAKVALEAFSAGSPSGKETPEPMIRARGYDWRQWRRSTTGPYRRSPSRSVDHAPRAASRSSSWTWPARTWYWRSWRSWPRCAAPVARATWRRARRAVIPGLSRASGAGGRVLSGRSCHRWAWRSLRMAGRVRSSAGRWRGGSACNFFTLALDKEVSVPDTTPMPDQTNLSTMTDSRLVEYRLFCERMRLDYSEGTTPKGRMRWLREAKRVDRHMDARPVAV